VAAGRLSTGDGLNHRRVDEAN